MSQANDRLLIGVHGTCVICQKTASPSPGTDSDAGLKMLMRCLNINVLKLFNIGESDNSGSSEAEEYLDRVSLIICSTCNVHALQFSRAYEKLEAAYQSIDNVSLALRERIVTGERNKEQDIFSFSSQRMDSLISANSGIHLRRELIPKLCQLRLLAASGPLITGLFSLFTIRIPLPFNNSFNGPSSSHTRDDSNVFSNGPSVSEFWTNAERTMEDYRNVPNEERAPLTSQVTVEHPSIIFKREPEDPVIVSVEGGADDGSVSGNDSQNQEVNAPTANSPPYPNDEFSYMRSSSTSSDDTVPVPVRGTPKRLTAKNSNGLYECGICDKTCSTYAGIYMHRKSKHANDPNVVLRTRTRATAASRTTAAEPKRPAPNTRNSQPAGYECSFCKRGFKYPSDRENHEVTIHPFNKLAGKLPPVTTEPKLKSAIKKFVQASQTEGKNKNLAAVCVGCNQEFKRGGKIKIHFLKHHIPILGRWIEQESCSSAPV